MNAEIYVSRTRIDEDEYEHNNSIVVVNKEPAKIHYESWKRALYRKKFMNDELPIHIVTPSQDLIETLVDQQKILEKRMKNLEQSNSTIIEKLDKLQGKKEKSRDEIICDKIAKRLEKELYGQIIAIDMEKKEMVGHGQSIDEAYDMALKNSKERQFNFRRVGFKGVDFW